MPKPVVPVSSASLDQSSVVVTDQAVDRRRLLEVGNDRVEHVVQRGGTRVDTGIMAPKLHASSVKTHLTFDDQLSAVELWAPSRERWTNMTVSPAAV